MLQGRRHDAHDGLAVVAKPMRSYSRRALSLSRITCRNGVSPRSSWRRMSLRHQPAREPAALEVGVRADAADLAQRAGVHALAGHRDEPLAVEEPK